MRKVLTVEGRPGAAGLGRTRGRVRWQVRAIGCVLMTIVCLGVLELSAYVYLRVFTGYDGEHLMSYRFDDYKNIQLTPGYRDTRGVAHNGQGFRRSEETSRVKPDGVYRIFDGTSEIHRGVIARNALKRGAALFDVHR